MNPTAPHIPQTQQAGGSTTEVGEKKRATAMAKGERRVQILQTMARMLQDPKGEKITTAALARELEVSEAALYRHFASKAQMYEGLIEFIETSLLGLLNQIAQSEASAVTKLQKSIHVLLIFAQKNPGMSRVLIGDALLHEHERLQLRVNQLLERLQASIKQCFREVAMECAWQPEVGLGIYSEFWMSWIVGRWHTYVRSGFQLSPAEHLEDTWKATGLNQLIQVTKPQP